MLDTVKEGLLYFNQVLNDIFLVLFWQKLPCHALHKSVVHYGNVTAPVVTIMYYIVILHYIVVSNGILASRYSVCDLLPVRCLKRVKSVLE